MIHHADMTQQRTLGRCICQDKGHGGIVRLDFLFISTGTHCIENCACRTRKPPICIEHENCGTATHFHPFMHEIHSRLVFMLLSLSGYLVWCCSIDSGHKTRFCILPNPLFLDVYWFLHVKYHLHQEIWEMINFLNYHTFTLASPKAVKPSK